jgi:hypothetical protein
MKKSKKQFYKGEKLLDVNDVVRRNPVICSDSTKRVSLRRKLIKKMAKYRGKQKKKSILREELMQKENGCIITIK